MAGTFFGFDTNLPNFDDLKDHELKYQKAVNDSKNDETFNVILPAPVPPLTDPDDIIHETSSGSRKASNGMSVRDMLLEEYNASAAGELEEEEIIETSISQLGLDDEQEDRQVKVPQELEDDVSWPTAPKHESFDDSAIFIQDLLSPDKRGIWTSPQSSDKSSHTPPRPSNSDKSEILKNIFGAPSNPAKDDELAGDQVVETTPIKAIRAEDLEKGFTSDSGYQKEDDRTPVIIERRMPRTPAAPPGFMFPMGTPPSGLPWMTPPGMMPIPPPMMLSGQMQRMLAASPRMALFNNMTRGMPPWPPGNRMPGHSPFMHNSPQPRFPRQQQQQQRRRGTNNYNNRQNNNNWNRRDDSRHSNMDYEEDMIKLPPSRLMTSREKEWLVKIQLMTLLSGDMNTTDFYYINFMNKKAAQETSAEDGKKSESEADNFNKLLDIVEQKKEERKYRPAVFQGSLGKLTVTTIHHPRQIMDLSSKEQEEDETQKSKSNEGIKKRFIIYGTIEKAYSVLLEISDIERRLNELPLEERKELLHEKAVKVDELFSSMKLSVKNWQRDKLNEVFLQMMCIAKGKRLLLRALPYFDTKYRESAFLSIISGIQVLVKKDAHDKILPQFLVVLADVLQNCDASFLCSLPVSIAFNNLSHLMASLLGLNFLILIWRHIRRLNEQNNDEGVTTILKEWDSLRKTTLVALSQMSPRNLEKHPTEIIQLKELLHQPDIVFEE